VGTHSLIGGGGPECVDVKLKDGVGLANISIVVFIDRRQRQQR